MATDHTAEVLQALAEQQPNLETALDEHSLCNPSWQRCRPHF